MVFLLYLGSGLAAEDIRFGDSIMGSNSNHHLQSSSSKSSSFPWKTLISSFCILPTMYLVNSGSRNFYSADFETIKYYLLLSSRRFRSAQRDLEHSGVPSCCRKSLQQATFTWNRQRRNDRQSDHLTIMRNRQKDITSNTMIIVIKTLFVYLYIVQGKWRDR